MIILNAKSLATYGTHAYRRGLIKGVICCGVSAVTTMAIVACRKHYLEHIARNKKGS